MPARTKATAPKIFPIAIVVSPVWMGAGRAPADLLDSGKRSPSAA
jgi:hypothetical protein